MGSIVAAGSQFVASPIDPLALKVVIMVKSIKSIDFFGEVWYNGVIR